MQGLQFGPVIYLFIFLKYSIKEIIIFQIRNEEFGTNNKLPAPLDT
jgi:hypothetical protein